MEGQKRKEKKKKGRRMLTMLLVVAAGLFLGEKIVGGECLAAAVPGAPQGVMAVGVKDQVVLSWEKVKGADGYEIYERKKGGVWSAVRVTAAGKTVLKNRENGERYQYKVRAYQTRKTGMKYGKFSQKSDTTLPERGTSTLRNLLKTAMAPVGSTMYIWGGGWNKADNSAGADGLRIGLNPRWRDFARKQKSSYAHKKYAYKRGYGLDCSGFVGWTVYNSFHTKKGKPGEGYVRKAKTMAETFAKKGWGTYKKASAVRDYRPGDIMSGPGHVYIVIGECEDGSVVLVHSSPAGVQISGTVSPAGKKDSDAVRLARKSMKKYYPSWYKKFPNVERNLSYLRQYSQFRWNTGKGSLMEDPDDYKEKTAKEVLRDLFSF